MLRLTFILHSFYQLFIYLGIPVERPEMVESTSLGAAFAAAVGINLIKFDEEEESHPNVTLFQSGEHQFITNASFRAMHVSIYHD